MVTFVRASMAGIVKFRHKFINMSLNFLNSYTGYIIKNSYTGISNLYEF